MKKIIVITLLIFISIPTFSVLKEGNLSSTLKVLRGELERSYKEQRQLFSIYQKRTQAQHEELVSIMKKNEQISLMLYSQKMDYTFDMSYACHEATEQYREFSRKRIPYDKILIKIGNEIERYHFLIEALRQIPPKLTNNGVPKDMPDSLLSLISDSLIDEVPFSLDTEGQRDRKICLAYATEMYNNLVVIRSDIQKDNEYYKIVSEKLRKANDYATKRYNNIRNNIFVNGEDSYFKTLATLPISFRSAKMDVEDKYSSTTITEKQGKKEKVNSQWRGPIVIGLTFFIIVYLLIAALLSNVIVRWVVPKRFRTEEFMAKKVYIILAAAIVIFAISISIARLYMYHNFFLMASKLLIEFSWLAGVIIISLLIRLSGKQINSGCRIYLPLMLMGFVIIAFRIIFIPNNLVALVFPPILLGFTIWAWFVNAKHNVNVPRRDLFYSWMSFSVMAISSFMAWWGYALFAVQILIWWLFQLTCILTITCLSDLLLLYEEKYLYKKIDSDNKIDREVLIRGEFIHKTWMYDFLRKALLPMAIVISIPISILWAADIFDLSDVISKFFFTDYVNIPKTIQFSFFKLIAVINVFFLFKYIKYLLRSLYHKYHKTKKEVSTKPNYTLADNVIAILVWGSYIIYVIKFLNVPSNSVTYIATGLATGLGFAMKDLLENFFYGISLMTGRVRVGDYIECDGIRGKVDNIGYQSTQIVTADGSIIAFLNSSLFSKNFKNITKNHGYEYVQVPVGVAYGVNIDELRPKLIKTVEEQMYKTADGKNVISTKRPIEVVFGNFGESSVDLFVTYWVLAEAKFTSMCKVREAIYNTLNANNIEIPYPQQDVYIRKMPK